MSFAPVLPVSGFLGYRLLTNTEEAQREVFNKQPAIERDVAYFTENIGKITSAEELVADRRLLRVALGAYGLDDKVDQRAYFRKVLEEGTESDEAFANRLVDPRYAEMTKAFGFGNSGGPQVAAPGFAKKITDAYRDRQFEVAVGDQDSDMRLALNFRREITKYANSENAESAAWFSVMGDNQLRAVFEGAFGLSSSTFGQLDVDRQRDDLKDLNNRYFGSKSLEVFRDSEKVDDLIKQFLIRRSIENGPSATTPGMSALTILSNGVGSIGTQNLVLSGLS